MHSFAYRLLPCCAWSRALHSFARARARAYVCRDRPPSPLPTTTTDLRARKTVWAPAHMVMERSGSHLVLLEPALGGNPMSICNENDDYLTSMRRMFNVLRGETLEPYKVHSTIIFFIKFVRI